MSVRTFAIAFLTACCAASAQGPGRVPRIGLVANTIPLTELSAPLLADGTPHAGQAIRDGLGKLGWVDGKNIRILLRSAEGDFAKLPSIFDELARVPVDVIVAVGPGVYPAAQATRTIPIVMTVSAGILGGPFLKSLSRPDRNLTGLTLEARDLNGKRLELLKQAVPKAARVALLEEEFACTDPSGSVHAAATKLGVSLLKVRFGSRDGLEAAFLEVVAQKADAVLVCDGVWVHRYGTQRVINDLAMRHGLPTIHAAGGSADTGALMAYGIDSMGQYRRVPYFIDRILKGAKPAELPIEQPTAVEFVVNLKVARALGISVPGSVLLQADRVIQ